MFYINDCRRYSYGKSVRMRRGTSRGSQSKSNNDEQPLEVMDSVINVSSFKKCCPCCICCPENNACLEKVGSWYFSYYKWYKKYFGEDKLLWMVYLLLREGAELLLQTQVLYIYSGYNLFTQEIELGKKPGVVIAFAVMLCINCIMYGICWLGYAFIGRLCRGIFFKQLLYVVDTIFDTFYAIFPLIMALQEQSNFSLALANLNLQSGYVSIHCVYISTC